MLQGYVLIFALLFLTYFSNRYISQQPNAREIVRSAVNEQDARNFDRPQKLPHAVPNGVRS